MNNLFLSRNIWYVSWVFFKGHGWTVFGMNFSRSDKFLPIKISYLFHDGGSCSRHWIGNKF